LGFSAKEFLIGTHLFLVNSSIICAVFRAINANNYGKRRRLQFPLYCKSGARSVAHIFKGVVIKQYIISARISTFLDAANIVNLSEAPMS
jgi:hypothetical protein